MDQKADDKKFLSKMTLREKIQDAINEVHAKMDFLDVNRKVMGADASLHDYLRFLTTTYGFILPLETALKTELVLNELAQRRIETIFRANLLEQDLMTLGQSKDQIRAIPLMPQIPLATSLPPAMGLLYTLNGSMLGGLTIARQIHKRFKLDQRGGAKFLNPFNDPREAAALFDRFVQKLNSFASDENEEREALNAAVNAFQKVNEWLEKC